MPKAGVLSQCKKALAVTLRPCCQMQTVSLIVQVMTLNITAARCLRSDSDADDEEHI